MSINHKYYRKISIVDVWLGSENATIEYFDEDEAILIPTLAGLESLANPHNEFDNHSEVIHDTFPKIFF